MPDPSLLRRAASCYQRGGWPHEAARCYRAAGSHQLAAQAWESCGAFADAVVDFEAAGLVERAAWLLAHHLEDPAGARAVIAGASEVGRREGDRLSEGTHLLRRLVLARCDVAEERAGQLVHETLTQVMDRLAARGGGSQNPELESWAVLTAEAMQRPDLVALIFAAAVRGHRFEARARWDEWSRRVLNVPLVLPPGPDAAPDVARTSVPSTSPGT
jgi:hypothetical protein